MFDQEVGSSFWIKIAGSPNNSLGWHWRMSNRNTGGPPGKRIIWQIMLSVESCVRLA